MNMKRRIPQYLAGLMIMALGVVLIKCSALGISPLSSIPDAVALITPLTLGNTSIAFHAFCILMQIIVEKKITLKTVLTLPLAVIFGYLIDLYMLFIVVEHAGWVLRVVLCLLGIAATGLGIVFIVGSDLMLPAPDALLHSVSENWHKPFPKVKICGDCLWVALTIVINLVSVGRLTSVGVGTILCALLTGRTMGLFKKWLPGLDLSKKA